MAMKCPSATHSAILRQSGRGGHWVIKINKSDIEISTSEI